MKSTCTLLLISGLLLSAAHTARADTACRTTEDANNSVLRIDGFWSPGNGDITIMLGNFDFYGVSAVGACVHDTSRASPTFHFVTDFNGNLLGWLPKVINHLCLTNLSEQMHILMTNQTQCGVPMTPLNYNGNHLVVYGQDDVDILFGGNGRETFYGGRHIDDLRDSGSGPGANPIYTGTLMGESNFDILTGSRGNNTILDGGAGGDAVVDLGGSRDVLRGGADDDCCIFDSDETFSVFNCGPGTDTVNGLSASKTDCENHKSNCDINAMSCFQR